MYLIIPALISIRHIFHCNQKCLLLFCCPSMTWKHLGRFTAEIFLLLGRLDKRQVPPCPAAPALVPSTPSQPSLVSPPPFSLPLYNSILGTIFPPRFWKQERTSLSAPWRDLPRSMQLRRQAAAPTARERCHAQGEIYSSSPLQTLHLVWCRADSSSIPGITNSSSSTEACTGCLGSHMLSPSPRAASLQWSWQTGAGSRRAAFQNQLLITGPRSGTYSIFTTQWYAANIFLPKRQKYVSSSYSLSLWKISVVCKETLCVCIRVCIWGGGEGGRG